MAKPSIDHPVQVLCLQQVDSASAFLTPGAEHVFPLQAKADTRVMEMPSLKAAQFLGPACILQLLLMGIGSLADQVKQSVVFFFLTLFVQLQGMC